VTGNDRVLALFRLAATDGRVRSGRYCLAAAFGTGYRLLFSLARRKRASTRANYSWLETQEPRLDEGENFGVAGCTGTWLSLQTEPPGGYSSRLAGGFALLPAASTQVDSWFRALQNGNSSGGLSFLE